MAQNWSNAEYLDRNFMYWLQEAAESLAELGESYAYQNIEWNNDTGSTQGSITGYEAHIGDPHFQFDRDPAWDMAQRLGNKAYQEHRGAWQNPPEHYRPAPDETIGDNGNPIAIVSVWTRYVTDSPLNEQVSTTLRDTLDVMGEQAERVIMSKMSELADYLRK